MTQERNHATIRDYLLTLRRRKLVILGIVIVAAAVAGALSLTQKKTYTAQASLQALDPSQSAAFAGFQQQQQNLPTTTAAQLAQIVTRPDVMQRVRTALHLPLTIPQLQSKIAVSQDQQSNFVLVNASASTPADAAALANATAKSVVAISNSDARAQFAHIADQENRRAAALIAPFAGKRYSTLPPSQQAQFQASSQTASQLEQLSARMNALSNGAVAAQLAALATPPTSPSAPHPTSNIILGAFAGLVLALLVVWFLESLDRRLRRPDEAEALLGLPVVGALPAGALGRVPGQGDDPTGLSPFRMIRTQLRFVGADEAQDQHSILVTSPMSGEGKTTVSLGLALSAASSGLSTLLIEADVHRPVHAKRLGLNQGPGLADYLKGGISPGEILQTFRFVDPSLHKSNGSTPNGNASTLTVITAGNTASFLGAELGSRKFADIIAEVTKVYDLVVIDSAPLLAVAETSEMVSFVDSIVACLRLGSTTLEQARAARGAFERLPKRPTGLVLTDLAQDAGGYYGYAYEYSAPKTSKAAQPVEH
jgi:capsular polysaccharide biosynthesis protein/MinD-like ATPase involved in chromosome partitioning or flagellar assembly